MDWVVFLKSSICRIWVGIEVRRIDEGIKALNPAPPIHFETRAPGRRIGAKPKSFAIKRMSARAGVEPPFHEVNLKPGS